MEHVKRHKELCIQITDLNKSYYVYNESKLPDAIYDQLFQELKAIEVLHPELVTPVSPTQTVGFMAARHFTKVAHPWPMLSLGNTFTASNVVEWIKTLPINAVIYGELKLDGASLELVYRKGKLFRAVTRGDGSIGEDVTLNAITIEGITLDFGVEYDYDIVVRGEVVVKTKVFNRVNAELAEQGKKQYVNKRNYASGALRQKDWRETGKRGLTFIAYSVEVDLEITVDKKLPDTGELDREWMMDHGFFVPPLQSIHTHATEAEWVTFLEGAFEVRDKWEFDIDGLVFKVDCHKQRKELGTNSREPKWATAYKFPASEGISTLEDVTIQVGRTGQLTPVAEITPVFIHGTTISRVTLHNIDEIERLGIGIGSLIVVKRAGDVIPKIVQGVDITPHEKRYVFPQQCPCCNGGTMIVRGKAPLFTRTIYCMNRNCKDRVIAHLVYTASRGVYNIMDLGTETISNLYNLCGFRTIQDHIRLLWLTEEQLLQSGLSEHQAKKLLGNIEKARTMPLDRLLVSFGIDGVAEGTSERLAAHFGSLEAISNATVEELEEVEKVGELTAQCIFEFFDTFKAEEYYQKWISGLKILQPAARNEKLKGKSIMITGSMFGDMTRKGITAYYKTMSASVTSSVTSSTHLALFGTKYTGHKLETAKKLKIPYKIFDEKGVIEECTFEDGVSITKF